MRMTLAEKIQKDLTDAMRAKDELRLSVLRMVKSAITYKESEKLRKIDEPESIQLLQTLVKQRKESIDQFTKGNRSDLVAKETKELAIIESYLPAGASDADQMNPPRQAGWFLLHLEAPNVPFQGVSSDGAKL